jgi:hypothetical protein
MMAKLADCLREHDSEKSAVLVEEVVDVTVTLTISVEVQ